MSACNNKVANNFDRLNRFIQPMQSCSWTYKQGVMLLLDSNKRNFGDAGMLHSGHDCSELFVDHTFVGI